MNGALLTMLAARAAAPPASGGAITYMGTVGGHSGVTVGIGAESASRVVIVALTLESYDASAGAVTIGGIAATVDADSFTNSTARYEPRVIVARAAVPAGTTTVVTLSGGGINRRSAIHVWTIDAPVTLTSSALNVARNTPTTITTTPGGFVIAAVYGNEAGYPGFTQGGLTTDYAADLGGSAHLAAHAASPGASLTATYSGGPPATVGTLVSYA